MENQFQIRVTYRLPSISYRSVEVPDSNKELQFFTISYSSVAIASHFQKTSKTLFQVSLLRSLMTDWWSTDPGAILIIYWRISL